MGIILPEESYIRGVRDITKKHGVLMICDEVKTGITAHWGGASTYFGIQPDLICLAKSIGGGVPVGAFGGRAEVMEVLSNGKFLSFFFFLFVKHSFFCV
jgi:glutamate-1-semialdehyde 2,1-aminomutase